MTNRLRKVMPDQGWTPAYWSVSQNSSLSLKALGLHTYLMSLPNDWEVSADRIAGQRKEGRDAVQAAMRELAKVGLLETVKERGKSGRFNTFTRVYATPNPGLLSAEASGNPVTLPGSGEPTTMCQAEDGTENPATPSAERSDFPATRPERENPVPAEVPENPVTLPERENPAPLLTEQSGFQGSGAKPDTGFPEPVNPAPKKKDSYKRTTTDASQPPPAPDDASAEAKGQSKPKADRGTRLPEDWWPDAALQSWVKQHCPHVVNPRVETEKFVRYWVAKSGQAATKIRWDLTYKNWMQTAEERAPRLNGRHPDIHITPPVIQQPRVPVTAESWGLVIPEGHNR